MPNRKDVKAEVTIFGMKSGAATTATGTPDKDHVNANAHVNADQHQNAEPGKPMPAPKVAVSDKTGWHKIGETTVSFAKDRDEVMVLGADRYVKLKFKATDAGIMINDITISYEDGTKQDVPVSATMAMGVESRVIDVPGAEKDIARISFVYKTVPNQAKDKAHLEIWGYKSNPDKSTGMK